MEIEKDLENYLDHGEISEDWCPEEVTSAIVTWIRSNIQPDEPIVSIGCGNGTLLLQLQKHAYTNLTGVDICPTAIKLAQKIAEDNCAKIRFEVADVLGPLPPSNKGSVLNQSYKLVIDKGFLDANNIISSEEEKNKENGGKYINNIDKLLRDDGYLLIASANNTEEELQLFCRSQTDKRYKVVTVIPTPTLEFAGKKGHDVTVVACRKSQ